MLEFYHNLEIPETINPVQVTLVSDCQQDVRVYSCPEGLLDFTVTAEIGKTSFYFEHHGPGGWNIIAENDQNQATMSCLICPVQQPVENAEGVE